MKTEARPRTNPHAANDKVNETVASTSGRAGDEPADLRSTLAVETVPERDRPWGSASLTPRFSNVSMANAEALFGGAFLYPFDVVRNCLDPRLHSILGEAARRALECIAPERHVSITV